MQGFNSSEARDGHAALVANLRNVCGCLGSAGSKQVIIQTANGKPETVSDAESAPHPPPDGFSLWRTFLELPWHVVPFLFGMFALVEALQQGGWVDFFAGVRRSSYHHLLLRTSDSVGMRRAGEAQLQSCFGVHAAMHSCSRAHAWHCGHSGPADGPSRFCLRTSQPYSR